MKQILIPTDFSKNSWNAIEYALAYFSKTPCDFYLLHVTLITNYPANEFSIFHSAEVIDKTLLKQGDTALKNLTKKIKKINPNPLHKFHTLNSYNYFIDAVNSKFKKNI